jgi:hypothetical protein
MVAKNPTHLIFTLENEAVARVCNKVLPNGQIVQVSDGVVVEDTTELARVVATMAESAGRQKLVGVDGTKKKGAER